MQLAVNIGGIPHLAKNERDVGHPAFVGSGKLLRGVGITMDGCPVLRNCSRKPGLPMDISARAKCWGCDWQCWGVPAWALRSREDGIGSAWSPSSRLIDALPMPSASSPVA